MELDRDLLLHRIARCQPGNLAGAVSSGGTPRQVTPKSLKPVTLSGTRRSITSRRAPTYPVAVIPIVCSYRLRYKTFSLPISVINHIAAVKRRRISSVFHDLSESPAQPQTLIQQFVRQAR